MKAKACTKCRQWKARCDGMQNGACSRCRTLKYPCVFDASFKRTSKSQRLKEMSLEIQQLKQNLQTTSELPPTPTPDEWPVGDVFISNPLPAPPKYRSLGDVGLTLSQVNECFRAYFARCHPYLPFKMKSNSHEEIYAASPFLFWVICAITSSPETRLWLSPMIKAMIADIHVLARSIETVQALLLLCLWQVFSVSSTIDNPCHFYSGIAVQLGLQLGLHCPMQVHSHINVREITTTDSDVKLTTWLACYVVNQVLSSNLGLPPTIPVDAHLVQSFDHPSVEPTLSQLCHIHYLSEQSTTSISATASGMLEPAVRASAIRHWEAQFAALEPTLGPDMVKKTFLHARLQLRSFALLDDMNITTDLLPIIRNAEDDACDLIDLCYGQNLTVTPQYIRWAIFNGALILIKLLRAGQTSKREVLEDKLEHVQQDLAISSDSSDDIFNKARERLRDLRYLEDKKLSPSILSRRGMSMVYDLLRISVEHRYEDALIQEVLDGFDYSLPSSYRA